MSLQKRNGDRFGAGSEEKQNEKRQDKYVRALIPTEVSNVKTPPLTRDTRAELVSGRNLAFPLTSMIAN